MRRGEQEIGDEEMRIRNQAGLKNMAKEKERFEILLEEIKGKVDLVLEGHGVLDKKIEDVKDMVREVDLKVEDTGKAVKQISKTLDEHVRQPAHVV